MSAVLLLRVSAFTSLLFALGHTLGGMKFWSPMGDNQVLQLMRSVHFDVMGTSRSYFDFYMGFGWSLSVAGFLQAILLWQISSLSKNAATARPMVAAIALAVGMSGIIAWQFLFSIPALFSLVLFGLLVATFVISRKTSPT
jgi:hypothetical protein